MKTRLPGFALIRAWWFFLLAFPALIFAADVDLASLRAKAEKGNVLAQYNLGLAYAEGRTAPKDLVEAYVWFRLAIENGGTGTALGGLLQQMSSDEIAAGRQRLDERRRTIPMVLAERRGAAAGAAPKRSGAAAPPAPTEDRFAAMQEELAVLRVDNARLTQQLEVRRDGPVNPGVRIAPTGAKKMPDLGAQLEAARKDLAAALKANDDLAARGKRLSDEGEALKRQIADHDDTAQRLAAAESQLAEARKELEAGKNRQAESEPLRQELARLHTENESLAGTNQHLEEQGRAAAELPRQLAEAQSTIEQLRKDNAVLQAHGTELTGRLTQAAPVASPSPAPAATPTDAGGADELARLKDELSRANSKVEMTVRSFALLRVENERLKTQLAQTRTP
jgi:predicted  nucleic acid-binding Zn-ribbon protein